MRGATRLRSWLALGLVGVGTLLGPGCADSSDEGAEGEGEHTGMTGTTADCEFSVLSVQLGQAAPVEVDINGLDVQELPGAQKNGLALDAVSRRGVRLSDIFRAAGIQAADDERVNAVARDGFDPLRTQLQGDVTRLPTYAFVETHGYVYVGSPGDKDPLYPQLEGKSLMVDYDLTRDDQVPAELGGNLEGINKFRWKMMEKLDAQTRGIFQIDPTP